MIKVLEAFSGIGAQAKALERLNIDYDIVATVDWDINAIMAYDLIHNGVQDLNPYLKYTKQELVSMLSKYTLSPDGKTPYKEGSLSRTSIEVLRRLLCAIERTNNLVSITDMTSRYTRRFGFVYVFISMSRFVDCRSMARQYEWN